MKIIILISVFIIILFTNSCDYDYYEAIEFNIEDTVSFEGQVIPIFNNSCNMSGCHNQGGISPDLSPNNAYRNLTMMGFIDTSDAESSILFKRMDATTNPMPPEGRLSDNQINTILYWIKQGAINN